MKEEKNIENLFQESFKKFEADPGANAWANISSGINSAVGASSSATSITTAASSTSSWIMTAVVGLGITGLAVSGYYIFNKSVEPKEGNKEVELNTPEISDPIENNTKNQNGAELKLENNSATDAPRSISLKKLMEENDGESSNTVAEEQPKTKELKREVEYNSDEAVESSTATEIIEQNSSENYGRVNEVETEIQEEEDAVNSNVNETTPSALDSKSKNKEVSSNNNPSNTGASEKAIENEIVKLQDLPNVFTPNDRYANDEFFINKKHFENYDRLDFQLFNKSGELVFEMSSSEEIRWNGQLNNGKIIPDGNYAYKLFVTYGNTREEFKGNVTSNP